jgi:hypothetical protein
MTEGLPGTAGDVLGQLWITYDIDFIKPIVPYNALTSVIAVTSQVDGSQVANADAGSWYVNLDNGPLSLAPSTVYSVARPNEATLSGYSGIYSTTATDPKPITFGGVVTEGGGDRYKLNLKRRGRYTITYSAKANTSASNKVVASNTVDQGESTYAPYVVTSGAPTWIVGTPSNSGTAVPYVMGTTTVTNGFTYSRTDEYVLFTADDENFITVGLPRFISHNVELVTGLYQRVSIRWESTVETTI